MQHKVIDIEDVVIRFAGDSGDGMQLTGTLFADSSALFGNEISTFPDYPAEIRAPQGTVSGVSGFQVHIGSIEIGPSLRLQLSWMRMPSTRRAFRRPDSRP